jgi:hypothetical protein
LSKTKRFKITATDPAVAPHLESDFLETNPFFQTGGP